MTTTVQTPAQSSYGMDESTFIEDPASDVDNARAPLYPSPSPCGKGGCAEHGELCAYHGDEVDSCPWCHSTWDRIARSEWHSCERQATWSNADRMARITKAKRMRLNATLGMDRSAHCDHLAEGVREFLRSSDPSLMSIGMARQDARA